MCDEKVGEEAIERKNKKIKRDVVRIGEKGSEGEG